MGKFIKDRAGVWHAAPYSLPERPALMPHQIAGEAWMRGWESCLLASDPGTGKSAQVIEVINGLPMTARVLIVCPSGLRANWLKELAIWLTEPRRCMVARRYVPDCQVVVMQYDALAKFEVQLRAVKWALVVFDEAHAMKGWASIKTRQVIGDPYTDALRAHQRIVMTATPILNRPAELWPLLAILGVSRDRKAFEARFCSKTDRNACRDPEGLRKLLAPVMLRQAKGEVLRLPPKERRIIAIEPAGELIGATGAADSWQKECEKAGRFAGRVAMAKLAALRIRTAIMKVSMSEVQRRIWWAVQEDKKLVIACHHHEVAEAIISLMPGGAAVIYTGRQSAQKRNEAVMRFQDDASCCVFVCTIGVAIGITLTAARRMMFLERSWTPALIEQTEDRIHRIGQTRPVLIEHIVIQGSLDARQIEIELAKQKIISSIIDKKSA